MITITLMTEIDTSIAVNADSLSMLWTWLRAVMNVRNVIGKELWQAIIGGSV